MIQNPKIKQLVAKLYDLEGLLILLDSKNNKCDDDLAYHIGDVASTIEGDTANVLMSIMQNSMAPENKADVIAESFSDHDELSDVNINSASEAKMEAEMIEILSNANATDSLDGSANENISEKSVPDAMEPESEDDNGNIENENDSNSEIEDEAAVSQSEYADEEMEKSADDDEYADEYEDDAIEDDELDDYIDDQDEDNNLTVDEAMQRNNAKDLKKAFSLNDRFRFRRELFGNSDAQMNETLHMIEIMSTIEEAEEYIYQDLQWDKESEEVKYFMSIITKHFL